MMKKALLNRTIRLAALASTLVCATGCPTKEKAPDSDHKEDDGHQHKEDDGHQHKKGDKHP